MKPNIRQLSFAIFATALISLAFQVVSLAAPRSIPKPLPTHPGNIFLTGEEIVVSLPAGDHLDCVVVDYEGRIVAEGAGIIKKGWLRVSNLGPGYYNLFRRGQDDARYWVSFAVLEPLRAPTPLTSPIDIDVAMAWFFPKEKMGEVTSLCQLAGINRVRDRLLWEQMEPKRGEFSGRNQYDESAETQTQAGLQLLQVAHNSSTWANPKTKHFPLDLRDIYNFYREMARRWQGKVLAFEPWNEADIKEFGGHTGSEMASLQKAAYLGLKAGNSNVIACQNVFAIRRAATLADFNDNEAWPYFDTFNLHHYERLQNYPSLYADFRAVSAGRPLWVTECSVHVYWTGDEKLKELSDEDLRLQSERLTKTYTLGLHQGAEDIFYFMLPHYTEGKIQYGLLHADLTPRPGYVALAAAGRLLAGAKPLGRVDLPADAGQAYFFDTELDGQKTDVMVVWSKTNTSYELGKPPQACYDHLGRAYPIEGKVLKVGRAPVYAVLANGSRPVLVPPPKTAKWLPGKPGSVVLQALLPETDIVLDKSAYKMKPTEPKTISLFAYNFGATKVSGRLNIEMPSQWAANFQRDVELAPGARQELPLRLDSQRDAGWTNAAIRISGDFGPAGKLVLALKLSAEH